MAEEKKSRTWEIPPPGPGTISGFFVAWVFVAAIIGLTLILMGIGKGPMPLRIVAYDIDVNGEVDQEALLAAIREANPMVLALRGRPEDLTKELALKLEVKEENFIARGPSAILSRYPIEKAGGGQLALIQYGKGARFGVVHVDPNGASGLNEAQDLMAAVRAARDMFGKAPHAIFVLVDGVPPAPPAGYVNAPIANPEDEERYIRDGVWRSSSNWHAFIPEAIEENLKECYLPANNETIQKYSDRLPLVTRFVFHKEDFE